MTNRVVAVLVLLALRVPAPALGQDAPPGAIRFESRMLSLGTSGGEFRRWHVMRAHIDEAHPERSEVDVEVDLNSLDHRRLGGAWPPVRRCLHRLVTARSPSRARNARLDDADRSTVDVTLELHGRTVTFPMTFIVEDRAARRIRGDVRCGGWISTWAPPRMAQHDGNPERRAGHGRGRQVPAGS